MGRVVIIENGGPPCQECYGFSPRDIDSPTLLTMHPVAYCRTCLILVAMAATPEDKERLGGLLDTWTLGRELLQRQGLCGKCGQLEK